MLVGEDCTSRFDGAIQVSAMSLVEALIERAEGRRDALSDADLDHAVERLIEALDDELGRSGALASEGLAAACGVIRTAMKNRVAESRAAAAAEPESAGRQSDSGTELAISNSNSKSETRNRNRNEIEETRGN